MKKNKRLTLSQLAKKCGVTYQCVHQAGVVKKRFPVYRDGIWWADASAAKFIGLVSGPPGPKPRKKVKKSSKKVKK